MKRRLSDLIKVCAVLALSASLATAAQDQKNVNNGPGGKAVKGSEVVGAKLFDQKGQHIGEINDIVFDENTGSVTHCILAVGGWLGIGENIVAVPSKFVRQAKDGAAEFVVDVEKSKLTSDMAFKKDEWPNMTDGWFKESYARFGMPYKPGVKLVRASTAIGAELFDQKGQDIGEIRDLLVHPASGKVAYGVCEVDEYASGADKLTNVPWNLIRQSEKDTQGFVVDTDEAKLKGAKYFSQNSWPDYNRADWHHSVYSYYGTDPFWAERAN